MLRILRDAGRQRRLTGWASGVPSSSSIDRQGLASSLARVLRQGGRFVVSTHYPTGDWLRRGGSYFAVEKVQERWRRGWEVAYWRQPLEVTCDEFTASGFLIERVHEPRPSAEMGRRYPDDADWLSVNPGFIVFSLLKR